MPHGVETPMPLGDRLEQGLRAAILDAQVRLWRVHPESPRPSDVQMPHRGGESMVVQVVDDRPVVDRVQHRVGDQPSEDRDPELVLSEIRPQPRRDHPAHQAFAPTQIDDLSPAECADHVEIVGCLEIIVSLLLRQGHRKTLRGPDVLPLGDVDEPSLVEHAFPCQTLQPDTVHEYRDVVTGDQVTDQRVQLPAGVEAARPPAFRLAHPEWAMRGQCQHGYAHIDAHHAHGTSSYAGDTGTPGERAHSMSTASGQSLEGLPGTMSANSLTAS